MSKTVLITGGAGGIGSATALKLAEKGYDVVINYFSSKDKALKLKETIEKEYGVRCLALKADVSKEAEVDAMVENIEEEFGSVDILINNAAIDMPDLFDLKDAQQFRKILDVNVVGAYNCAKRVFPKMREKGWGRIINISSTNGINTYYPMCFDYDA